MDRFLMPGKLVLTNCESKFLIQYIFTHYYTGIDSIESKCRQFKSDWLNGKTFHSLNIGARETIVCKDSVVLDLSIIDVLQDFTTCQKNVS